MKIELGGGKKVRDGWINLDYYSKTADIKLDLRTCPKLPFHDQSIEKVFSSHCIEHIENNHFEYLLKELYRITKKGALIRFSCPDTDLFYKAYGEKDESKFTWIFGKTLEERLINCFVSYERGTGVEGVNPETVKKFYNELPKEAFLDWTLTHIDRSRPYIAHCNWFNEDKLFKMLTKAGFKNIERSEPNQSRDEELRQGFDGHLAISIFMECVK